LGSHVGKNERLEVMKKLVALLAFISITFGGLVAGTAPASAISAADDATLASVTLGNYNQLDGPFQPNRTNYDVFASNSTVSWTLTASNPLATVKLSRNGVQATDTGTLNNVQTYAQATNQVTTVEVTSPDSTKTMTYTFNVSSRVIVQPELVSLSETRFSNAGGTFITANIKHAFFGNDDYCGTYARYQYISTDGDRETRGISRQSYTVSNDGVYSVVFKLRATDYNYTFTGKVPLIIYNECQTRSESGNYESWSEASTFIKDALTAYQPSLTSHTIPDQITFGQVMDFKGPGISGEADSLEVRMVDPETGASIGAYNSWRMGEDWGRWRLGGDWNPEYWSKTKPVDVILQIEDYYDGDPIVLVKKRVTFVPYGPKNVRVISPRGPIIGGNLIRIQGQDLCNNYQESNTVVRIGGQDAPMNWPNVACSWNSSDGYQYDDGEDRLEVFVPAGTQAGQVPIVVDIGFGPVTLSTKYTYGAKPTLTSVSPATVANTGGSIVTLTGTSFGSSGTPTVTIDGLKAPWVQRVSATKILAMVPANAGKTGAVDLNVISSSGGGALDAPGTITLAAATAAPSVTSVTPNALGLAGGDTITIKGTGFTAGSTGVKIGDYVAPIISSTATELQVELPSGDAAGAQDVVVGTPTGLVTKAGAFTYLATPGVTTITPANIATTAAASSSKVTIVGIGFGASGTIKVGSKAAVSYTATANGTTISNISIPNATAARIAIVITPKGSKKSYNGTVVVSAPKITNFSTDTDWRGAGIINTSTQSRAVSGPAGGGKFRLDGTGFGTSGKIKVGTALVTPTTYSDTAITFVMPARTVGIYDITVVPTVGSATAVAARALGVAVGQQAATITKIESAVDNDRSAARYTFDPSADVSDLFVITGTRLNGTDGTKTRVYLTWGDEPITPVSVSATSITFRAPRTLSPTNWWQVRVVTNVEETYQRYGILYVGNAPQPTTMTPSSGLCLKTATAGRNPAQLSATGNDVFGASGSVTIDGVAIPAAAVTWATGQVDVNLANLTTDLASPWGAKSVTFTPTDATKVPQTFGFYCGVGASVSTTLGGSTSSLTIQAGTSYTAGASFVDPLPNSPFTPAANGYVWQTAEDHLLGAWSRGVNSGLPTAAGDYYVRVNAGAGTYDREKYVSVVNSNDVHLIINGSPITFTPKLRANAGNSITYKGQLGDGTGGSSNDIMFTNTTAANAVTSVTWQHRNNACALNDAATGWSSGLPKDVAIHTSNCGGDDSTVTSWQIRVASFQMLSGGVDRAPYYIPTYNTFLLTINKKSVTATSVKVEKTYDGTDAATLGEITLTGAVEGDDVSLNPSSSVGATFSDATAGSGKTITLASPLALSSNWARNYTLTNSNLAITGKILKADAKVKLTPAVSSIVISNTQTVNVTVATTDNRTGLAPEAAAGVPDAVVTSKTPSKCSYSAGVVTAIAAGECIIEARQAASTNYNASIAWHDSETTVESITIKIFPAPKTLSVVADDITVAVGEGYGASAVVTGLLDGDSLDGFTFDYYQGTTLLAGPPTAVGTYRIVPSGGNLSAADALAYSNIYKYVAGKLVITPAPPTLTLISPNHGPEAGGNTVVLTGTGFDAVTSVVIGGITLRKPKFTVNGTATEITFKAPAGVGVVDLTLRAGNASVTGQYIYDAPPVVTSDFSLSINADSLVGVRFSGNKVTITGTGLKPNSQYTLTLGSSKSLLFKATTDSSGNFNRTITVPSKACALTGKQSLLLSGVKPDGSDAEVTEYIVLANDCEVLAVAEKSETKQWTLSGFLFDYLKADLTAGGVKSLSSLVPLIKGAKTVTIYGYTQTDGVSEATKRANIILAANRSKTVMEFLKAKGIKAVYKTIAKGGVDPVSTTDQSKNRRVVIEANY